MAGTISAAARERFQISRTLGAGGMGVVYEAFDRTRNETVALKTLRRADAEAIYRLKREFRALANLEHPNLVRLYDLFVEPDACYFTMELVAGVDLATYVGARETADATAQTIAPEGLRLFDEDALRHALAGLLRGLEALHEAGLLHRDLKPSNVLVTPQGRVVVLDFGLVVDAHAAVQQTRHGAVTGTIAYMAPEQARGESELTTACDVYALGVILYELLTGRLPFEGPPLRVMFSKQTQEPPSASRIVKAVPADLDELASALMARDPASRPRVQDALGRLGTSQSRAVHTSSSAGAAPKLVGRAAEVAELEATYQRTADGKPALTLVRGRSGIGKSALLQSFARQVEASGAVVLSGRCYESESVPFKGLDGIVDALSRVLAMAAPSELERLLPPELGDLATLFPVLRRIQPVAAAYARRMPGEQSAQRVRSQGFAGLRELLRRLGEATPLLVVLDDVQWADDDSARGMVDLVRGEDPPRMMLVLGARPSEGAPVVRDLFGEGVSEAIASLPRSVVELGPLGLDSMREIAERELGSKSSLVDLVARDSEGVPFAAGELVRFLREGDLDGASLDRGAPIDSIVRRRVAMLDETARRVLEMIAISGEPTSAAVVLRALSLPEDDRSSIDALRGRAFVRSARSGYGASIDTAHDRIRESVLESLDPTKRAELHRRLALVMEGLEMPPHDRLARHFAAAGDRALARLHAAAAAEKASSALAFLRSAELYGLALELSEPGEREPLLAPYAEVLAAAGRYGDAALVWLEAGAKSTGAKAREMKSRAAECCLYAGRIDDGLDLLDALANEIGVRIPQHRWAVLWELLKGQLRLGLRGLRFRIRSSSEIRKTDLDHVRTLGAIALQYMPLDPFRGAVTTLRYLLAALELGDPDELTTALGLEAYIRAGFGWRRGAARLIGILDDLAIQGASAKGKAWAFIARSSLAIFTGDRRAAMAYSEKAFEAISALPSAPSWLLSLAHFVDGFNLFFDLSAASYRRLVEFVEDREGRSGPCSELRLRAFAIQAHHLIAGRPESMLALIDDERWRSATRRDIALRTTAEQYAATARIYLGEPALALPLAERVRAAYRRQGTWRSTMARGGGLMTLAASALAMGDRRLVRRCFREIGTPRHDLARLFHHVLGAAAEFADGRNDGACRELERLRALAVAREFPFFEALACFTLGRILPDASGDEPRARYLAIMAESGVVDPDLALWVWFPIGERPPRTGSRRSMWSTPELVARREPARREHAASA